MLRKIRIIFALICFSALTLLLLGITWHGYVYMTFVAKIQFIPAVLALNVTAIVGLILMTLLFGRIYCSVICPLGVMQDVFSWIGGKIKRNRFNYSAEKRALRYVILMIFIIALIMGFAPLTTILEPYAAYGRIVNTLLKPLVDTLNNYIADIAWEHGSYAFTPVEVWLRGVTVPIVAALTLICIVALALKSGRTYCNTICPVGSMLSLLARFSLVKVRFDKDKCRNCSLCEKNCKASAIDFRNGTIDYSRCVVCGDCIDKCRFDALHYTLDRKNQQHEVQIDTSRRAMIVATTSATVAATTAKAMAAVNSGVATVSDKAILHRQHHILPPGAVTHDRFAKKCIACQLCVSACPNNVLRPAADAGRFMQPEMSYERGYCRPECNQCGQVCPTSAIKEFEVWEKTDIHIGHAVWIKENCVVLNDNVSCGNCARHCPVEAINMVPYKDKPFQKIPAVDVTKCIGCGACENLCPARPFSAIYIEGHQQHVYA